MTDAEKLTMLKAMTGEENESVLSTYLSIAGNKVLKRAYPFNSTVTEVPDRYAYNQVEIAAYLVNKRGAEGERHTARTVFPAPMRTEMCRLRSCVRLFPVPALSGRNRWYEGHGAK